MQKVLCAAGGLVREKGKEEVEGASASPMEAGEVSRCLVPHFCRGFDAQEGLDPWDGA